MNEVVVIVKDSYGNEFKRTWAGTENKLDIIRWTITSEDIRYYIDITTILSIIIKEA